MTTASNNNNSSLCSLEEARSELTNILPILCKCNDAETVLDTTESTNKKNHHQQQQQQQFVELLKQHSSLLTEEILIGNANYGALPPLLHLIRNGASLELVRQVFQLCPRILLDPDTAAATPVLHMACEAYARYPNRSAEKEEHCLKTIQFLLQKVPESILQKEKEQLPIHALLQAAHTAENPASLKAIQLLAPMERQNIHTTRSHLQQQQQQQQLQLDLLPLEMALLLDYPNQVIRYLAKCLSQATADTASVTIHTATENDQTFHILGTQMDEERAQIICNHLLLLTTNDNNNKYNDNTNSILFPNKLDVRVHYWTRDAFRIVMKALLQIKDHISQLSFYELPGRIMEKTRETRQWVPDYLYQATALQELCISPGAIALGGDHTPEFAAIVNSICRTPTRQLHTLRLYNFEVGFLQPVLKLLSNECHRLRTMELDCCDIDLVDPDSWQEQLLTGDTDSSRQPWNNNRCESLLLSINHSDMYLELVRLILSNMPCLQTLALNPCFVDQEEHPHWNRQWLELIENANANANAKNKPTTKNKLSSLQIDLFGMVQPNSLLRFLSSSNCPEENVVLKDLKLKQGGWNQYDDNDDDHNSNTIPNIVWEESSLQHLTMTFLDVDGDYDYLKHLLTEIQTKAPKLKRLHLGVSQNKIPTWEDTMGAQNHQEENSRKLLEVFGLVQKEAKDGLEVTVAT